MPADSIPAIPKFTHCPDRAAITRHEARQKCVKILGRKEQCSGEIVYELWELNDGTMVIVHDWYNDFQAQAEFVTLS